MSESPDAPPSVQKIAITEREMAAAIGMSVQFLREDRRTKRRIPFYRLGASIRYDVDRVREALALIEEGGIQRRTKVTR